MKNKILINIHYLFAGGLENVMAIVTAIRLNDESIAF